MMNYYWNIINPGGTLRYSESIKYNTALQNMNEKRCQCAISKRLFMYTGD